MIQRKQNLFLSVMAIICMVMLTTDMRISTAATRAAKNDSSGYNSTILGITPFMENGGDTVILQTYTIVNQMLISGLVIYLFISLISVFLYKKLKLQLRLASFNFIVLALIIFLMFKSHFDMVNLASFKLGHSVETSYGFALLMPVFLGVLNVLSFRGIKKDIDLLASVDRLR